jgi:hypothetical protein
LKRLLALAVLAFIACEEVRNDPGADAMMQVQGSQFRRGPMPSENGGPPVVSANLATITVAGVNDLIGNGELDRRANAVAIGLEGDVGYWTIPADTPDLAQPTEPTFGFVFGLAAALGPGTYSYVVRAVDVDGHFGPPTIRPLTIVPRSAPVGHLVVSLTWDSAVDLDLHVVLPNGVEIFKRNPAEYVPPPISAGPYDPFALHDGGVLDRDSNAHCVLDGQRAEDAVWQNLPPQGHYVVRVDTFSMCDAASANWRVEALLDGKRIGSASGVATENDLRFDHNRGSGVLALEFDVP